MPMMIAKRAIDEYLHPEEGFDNFDWVKKITKEELLDELNEYEIPPKFKTDPYLHQLQAFFVGSNMDRFSFLMEMGYGKSKTVIDIVSYLHLLGEDPNTLIIANNAAGVYTWVEEISTHSDLSFSIVLGDREAKRNALEDAKNFHIGTYDSISSYATVLRKSRSKKKQGKKARHISKADMKELTELFDVLILDELHNTMNPASLISRVCLRISVSCKYVYGLTGTPMGRNPEALFGEMLCVDNGETFGDSIALFSACYYEERLKYGTYKERVFNKSMLPNITKRLKHRSLSYAENECFDMPDVVKQVYRVAMTTEMKRYRDDLLVAARQNKEEMKVRNTFVRLRQLMGGNLVAEDDEGKVIAPLRENPKADLLIDLIGTVPVDRKVVVFYEYTASGDLAEKAMKKEGLRCLRLWGGTKNTAEVLDKFSNDSSIKILLANSQSGGTGLNLQVANYVIYLESPVSPIVRSQSEKRIRPRMQKRSFVYDIVVKSSIDERILEYLKEGKDLLQAIMKGKTGTELLG